MNLPCAITCDSASTDSVFSRYSVAMVQLLLLVVSHQLSQWLIVDVPHGFVNSIGNNQCKKLQTSIVESVKHPGQALRYSAMGLAIGHSFCATLLVARRVPNTLYTNIHKYTGYCFLLFDRMNLLVPLYLILRYQQQLSPLGYCV